MAVLVSDLESLLSRQAILTRKECLDSGMTIRTLERLVREGHLVKARNGFYCGPDAEAHGLFDFSLVSKISGGVIWGASAGRLHSLTDDIPFAIHVLVPHDQTRHTDRYGGLDVQTKRTRDSDALDIGVEVFREHGFEFKVTDKTRTVVDLVRWGDVRQHAVEAVRAYLAEGGSPADLQEMAQVFDVGPEISAMTDGVLAAFERSPTM